MLLPLADGGQRRQKGESIFTPYGQQACVILPHLEGCVV
jgi:hypothetical protein